jgi:hypothetical protein
VYGGSVAGKNFYSWSHLSIVRHAVQTSRWFLSTGWWKDSAGDSMQLLINLNVGQPEPSALTPASGLVVYQLFSWIDGPRSSSLPKSPLPIDYFVNPVALRGLAAVQVNADQSLSIELIPIDDGRAPAFTGFSAAKRTYRR